VIWNGDGDIVLTLLVYWIHMDEDYQVAGDESGRKFIWPCPSLKYELIGIGHMD